MAIQAPFSGLSAHFCLEEAIGVTAFGLGLVQGRVGLVQQCLAVGRIDRKDRSGGCSFYSPQMRTVFNLVVHFTLKNLPQPFTASRQSRHNRTYRNSENLCGFRIG